MEQHKHCITAEEIRDLVGEHPVLVEVGSHEGSDTAEFLKAMSGCRIHCFEPDERPRKRFVAAGILSNPRVTLHPVAVAEINGMKPFHASTGKAGHMDDWDYSGSLQVPTGHLTHSPEIGFKEPVLVHCVKLDTWLASFSSYIHMIDFAHVDIQGGQRNFIAGARIALAVTQFLYIESHYRPLYEGEPTQEELIELLPGFEPLGVYGRDNLLFRNRHNLP